MLKRFFSIFVSSAAGLLALAVVLVVAQHPAGTAWAAPEFKPLASTLTFGVDCSSIQQCIDNANPGDEVHVPAGNYTESLTVAKDISITGDLSSTTIIHALDNERVMTITGASVYLADLMMTGGVMSRTIFTPVALNSGGGLYVQEAQVALVDVAIKDNTVLWFGGGLYALTSTVSLTGVEISGNNAHDGGGVLIEDSQATLLDVTLLSNTAGPEGSGEGGGLEAWTSVVTLTAVNIRGNNAYAGGGVGGLYANITFNSGAINQNTATGVGGGMTVGPGETTLVGGEIVSNTAVGQRGGGVYNAFSHMILSGTQVLNNSAPEGGGIALDGQGADTVMTQTGGLIAGNSAVNGGGIYNKGGVLVLSGGSVISNSAQQGGGIANIESSIPNDISQVQLAGTLVASNTATSSGGGVYVSGASSLLTLTAGSIEHNVTVNSAGGGIFVQDSHAALMGGQIFDNRASIGGGVAANPGIIELSGSDIFSNGAAVSGNSGGGVYLDGNHPVFTQTGGTIRDNTGIECGGLCAHGGAVALLGGSITGNSGAFGAGVLAASNSYGPAQVVLSGGVVASNTATFQAQGGGIQVAGSNGVPAYFTQTAGSIAYNTAVGAGGLLLMDAQGWLEGGDISFNSALNWGGVFLGGNSAFTQTGGAVAGNTATNNGGGVGGQGSRIALLGGSVASNTAITGGGVYQEAGGATLIDGGQIFSNSAQYGGGIASIDAASLLTLTGGSVMSNVASSFGGGIYVVSGTMTLAGAGIYGNSARFGGGMAANSFKVTVLSGSIQHNTASGAGGGIILNSGQLTLAGGLISSNSAGVAGGVGVGQAQTLLSGSQIMSNSAQYGGGVALSDASSVFTQTGGVVAGNYASIDGGGIASPGMVTLLGGSVTNNTAQHGGGISQFSSGGFTKIAGGLVAASNTAYLGGGISILGTRSLFTQTSGSIEHNNAFLGGGVYQGLGQSWLSGGQIISNSADSGGGGVAVYGTGTVLTQTGGLIAGNTAPAGGGLWNDAGQVILAGGAILSNTAHNGGGIYSSSDISGSVPVAAQLIISGGLVASNTASVEGGGIYLNGPVSFLTQTAGAIEYNSAFLAGGLSMEGGQASLTDADIVHNQATTAGGVAVLGPDSVFSQNGGQISFNTDGAMLIGNTGAVTVNINGALIFSNTGAGSATGGIIINRGSLVITGSLILSNTGSSAGALRQLAPSGPVSVTMTNSCIEGNGPITSVANALGPTIDARANWWGAANGPAGAGPGSGDAVSSGVDFSGFLSAPPVAGCLVATAELTVTRTGSGLGTVTSTRAGINCGADCAKTFVANTVVTLTATPAVSSTFTGWAGACGGTGDCVVTLTQPAQVTATFTINAYPLTVANSGTGGGLVSSTPAGINCGITCTNSYVYGTVVTLTATPVVSSTFTGWTGACTGSGACVVTLTQPAQVTATFMLKAYLLSVGRTGSGAGTVTSQPAGINCGLNCAVTFNHGSVVTLTAQPGLSSTFTGWQGGCAGLGACVVTITQPTAVTATFTLKSYTVTVMLAGTGNGLITSTPAGLSCAPTCAASFTYGAALTLTAAPNLGSSFAGWSGVCGGAGTCGLVVTQAVTLTATFNTVPPQLKIYLPMVTRGAAAESSQSAAAGREARGVIGPEARRQQG